MEFILSIVLYLPIKHKDKICRRHTGGQHRKAARAALITALNTNQRAISEQSTNKLQSINS